MQSPETVPALQRLPANDGLSFGSVEPQFESMQHLTWPLEPGGNESLHGCTTGEFR